MHLTFNINAGQRVEFYERGDFFRLMDSSGPVSVEYYFNGKEVAEAVNVGEGYAERFLQGGFDRFAITSAMAQTIQIAAREGGEVWYDTPPVGNVAITNTNGAFTHASHTVTTTSGVLKNANPARRYLLIQNNDATGFVYVRFDGVAATTANAIKIEPGGSLELSNFVPTGEIEAIGDIASNANVRTMEG